MKSLLLSLCAAGALALSASPAKADDWHRGYPGYRGHYHHHGYYRGGYGDGWRSYYPGYNYRYSAPYYGGYYPYGSPYYRYSSPYYYGPGFNFGYGGPRASVWFGF